MGHPPGVEGLAEGPVRLSLADRNRAARPGFDRRPNTGLARRGFDTLSSAAMTALSIVVPCFNEEPCLEALHQRLTAAARATAGEDYEIVFVNDGSRDGSWEIMRRLAASDPRLV